jgi:hypothetical protein
VSKIREPAPPGLITEIKSGAQFCELLNTDIGSVCKDIRIQDDILLHIKPPVGIEVDIADERSISLANVLERYSLAPKFKLLIAYILAKSVWQFYESDFMKVRWTAESIQLFPEKEDEDGDPEERGIDWAPYFALPYDDSSHGLCAERLPRGDIIHRYPRVLALGTLLYELGRNRTKAKAPSQAATTSASPVEPPPLARILNDEMRRIQVQVYKNQWPAIDLKDTETLERYRLIVLDCASEDLFTPSPPEDSRKSLEELEEGLTIEERRAILFQKVVLPLKKLVQKTGWVDQDGKIQRKLVGGVAAKLQEAKLPSSNSAKFPADSPNFDKNGIPLDDSGLVTMEPKSPRYTA